MRTWCAWRDFTYVRQRTRWLADPDYARRCCERMFSPELRSGSRVLDVGCGWGRFLSPLARLGCDVYGIDVSDQQWGYWQRMREQEPHIRMLLAEGMMLPFADRVFDAVLCISVLHEMPQPDRAIREMVRVMRPGGTLYLVSPNMERLWGRAGNEGMVATQLRALRMTVVKAWGEGWYVPVLTSLLTLFAPYAMTLSYRSARLAKWARPDQWLHRVVVYRLDGS